MFEALRAFLDRLADKFSRPTEHHPHGFSKVEMLKAASRMSAPKALREFVRYCGVGRRKDPELTAAAEALATALPVASLIELEDIFRIDRARAPHWNAAPPWRLVPDDVAALPNGGGVRVTLLHLATMHRDGRVREQAVRRLASGVDVIAWPWLLLRLNDWVEPVRSAAAVGVKQRLLPSSADAAAASLPILERLRQSGREKPVELLGRIEALLTASEGRAALCAAMLHAPTKTARIAMRLWVRHVGLAEWAPIWPQLLRHPDALIRSEAACKLAREADATTAAGMVDVLCTDRLSRIRIEGLGIAARIPGAEGEARLLRAMFDSSSGVRATARLLLAERGPVDFADMYRRQVVATTPSALAPAIAGLGETGSVADLPLIVPLFDHPKPRVRLAAVAVGAQWDRDAVFDDLQRLLSDVSPAVSRRAAEALRPDADRLDLERLMRRFAPPTPAHVRRSIFLLLSARPRWERLRHLIATLGDVDPKLDSRARIGIELWIAKSRRSFDSPSTEDANALLDTLNAHGGRVSAGIEAEIRGALAAYRRPASG